MRKLFFIFCCIIIFSYTIINSYAAPPEFNPNIIAGPTGPVMTGEEFGPRPEPLSTLNEPQPIIEAQSPVVPTSDPGPSFFLHKVTFEGLLFFQEEDLIPFTTPYLNREVHLSDINQMANDITTYLRKCGYVLSQAIVPAQSIRHGEVRIQIIEGYIDQVDLQCANDTLRGSEFFIRQMLDKITLDRPLHNSTLERYLLLVDDLGGITVRSVIKPSQINPGAATLVAVIEQELLDGQLTYDNYGSQFIGWDRLYGRASFHSVFQQFETVAVQAATVPSNVKELKQIQVQYDQPLGSEGFDVYVMGLISDAKPSSPFVTDILLNGDNRFLTIGGRYPIIRSCNENLNVGALFDIRNSKSTFFDILFINDHLRVLRAYGSYDWADTWQGVNMIYGAVSQGIPILGASKSNALNLSRIGGDVNFTKFNLTLQRYQQIWGPFAATITMDAQLTGDKLLSAEQIGFGGNYYGRGYGAAEIVGDIGFGTEIELIARLPDSETSFYRNPQLYLFYDLGTVHNNGAIILDKNQTITSGGFGLRSYVLNDYIYFDVVLARQLTRDTIIPGDEATKGQFSVGIIF